MRFLLMICLGVCSALLGGGIPLEEGLSVDTLDNGVQIWLKEQSVPSQSISCRIVAKESQEGLPQVFSMDCPVEAFEDELFCLIDTCKGSLAKEEESNLAIVAVGDFDKHQLSGFLAQAFQVFAKRRPVTTTGSLTLNPSSQADKIFLSLYYHNALQELKTDQDMKRLWTIYLLQAMVQERFRKVITDEGGQALASAEVKYVLPATHSMMQSRLFPHHDPALVLTKCLHALQEIKKSGFSDLELSGAKAQLQNKLSLFYQRSPNNAVLADHLASHFAFGAGCPDYTVFMTMSFKIIGDLEMQDVHAILGETFKDADRRVRVTAPSSIDIPEAPLLAALEGYKTDGIILVPGSQETKSDVFAQLPLTTAEAKLIYELIDNLGKKSKAALLFNTGTMLKLGEDIQHIHPLRFLEVVFTNPDLKESMEKVLNDHFKWDGFLNGSFGQRGFADKMRHEFNRNNLFPYVLGFSQAVKAHPDQIRTLFEKQEWDKLVIYLIKLKN